MFLDKAFHFAEAAFELVVCALQGDVGVKSAVAGHIDQAEHDIAELVFEAVDVRIFRIDLFHFGPEFCKFLLDFIENRSRFAPVKANLRDPADNVLATGKRWHGLADFIHNRLARMLQVVLFLRLDAVPAAADIVGGIDLSVAKHMRVPAHHLFAKALNHVVNGKVALFLAHLRMENYLEQHIAQFLAHVFLVALLCGINKFTTFFDQIRQQRMRILLTVPRAAVLRAEASHNIDKVIKRVFHAVKDRKYKGALLLHNKFIKLLSVIKSFPRSFLLFHSRTCGNFNKNMETKRLYSEPYRKLSPEQYPLELANSKFCPKQLFCKGTLPAAGAIGIAMVGTRRPTASAEELCRRLVSSLKGTNAVVVSGLAQGIDYYSHKAALEAGIPTLAVLAQGLDAKIEGERSTLAERILESGGALLSEYEGDSPAFKGRFVARNRLISGMSLSTLVVQSRKTGGALITAQYCLDEGKLLLAVPGSFDCDLYRGTNTLLDSGHAKPVFIPESLRSVAGFPLLEGAKIDDLAVCGVKLSPDAQKVFDRFNGFRKTFSELQQEFEFKAPKVLAILTELEISGLVTSKDNFQFYFNGA